MLFCVVLPTENRDLRASYVHSSSTQGFLIRVIIQLMRAESNSKSFSSVFVIVLYSLHFLWCLFFTNDAYGAFHVCQQCYWRTTCSPTLLMERYMLAANVIRVLVSVNVV